jgi:hypothetical protein
LLGSRLAIPQAGDPGTRDSITVTLQNVAGNIVGQGHTHDGRCGVKSANLMHEAGQSNRAAAVTAMQGAMVAAGDNFVSGK